MREQDQGIKEKPVLMTATTRAYLEKKLEAARTRHSQSQLGMGLAAEDDWHGNGIYDMFLHLTYVNESQVATLQIALRSTQIISPRNEIDVVRVGNEVVVRFENESEDEIYTILGPLDSMANPHWLSSESLVGKTLLGRRSGQKVKYTDVNKNGHEIEIKEIRPGKF